MALTTRNHTVNVRTFFLPTLSLKQLFCPPRSLFIDKFAQDNTSCSGGGSPPNPPLGKGQRDRESGARKIYKLKPHECSPKNSKNPSLTVLLKTIMRFKLLYEKCQLSKQGGGLFLAENPRELKLFVEGILDCISIRASEQKLGPQFICSRK
jgi:hypothetical protein